jgi:5,10-methylenetetrahydromethanopterin reductase
MKIDATIPMDRTVPEQVEYARRLEAMGFDGAGLADHMEHGRDVYSALAVIAAQTESITLYPCVTNPVTRHPWVLANVTHSIDEIAPGRFKLIVGAGDSAVIHTGTKPATVAWMRESVTSVQKLLRGETTSFGDQKEERITGIAPPAPPVVVAAGGPRMTELAGEVGDEGFLLTGFHPRILKMVRRDLEAGARRSGRSLDGYKLAHYTLVRFEEDKEAASEFGRRALMQWAAMSFFRASLRELEAEPDALGSLSAPEVGKLADAFFVIGPVGKVTEQLQEVSRAGGLDSTVCVLSGPDGGDAALDTFAREVLPKLK